MSAVAPTQPGAALGSPRVHWRRTDSTNERARELAVAGAPHGTLVTASQQSAGRGRQGRRWSAPAGSSVLMSLLLRRPPMLLPLMAAVAVCEVAGEQALIKWPNDVVLPQRAPDGTRTLGKLAGILVEARPQEGWAVLGIGLNVAVRLEELPAELRAPGAGRPASGMHAASMALHPRELEPTLARLLATLELRLAQDEQTSLQAWRARDALLGREVAWDGGHGLAQGIDGLGRLIVAPPEGGLRTIGAGEVHLQRID